MLESAHTGDITSLSGNWPRPHTCDTGANGERMFCRTLIWLRIFDTEVLAGVIEVVTASY